MSYPEPFLRRMEERLGAEVEAFLQALTAAPKTTIRLHPYKGATLFPDAERVPWHPLGRILSARPDFEKEPLWHAGAYYVQEASGMSMRAFIPPKRPLRVIDLSAAPGGKATLILGELGLSGGLLIANDPEPRRRSALQENLERWGIPAYFITGRHPQYWAQRYPALFDLVILDAPCSGEGLWRKDNRAICQWSPQLVQRMQRLQRNLLFAAKALTAPGGRLIYSTCTFSPQENEENLAYAFADDREWEPVLWENPPSEVVPISYEGGGVGYYFYPHRSPGEGFFISAWQRRGNPTRKIVSSLKPLSHPPYPLPAEIQAFRFKEETYALTEAAMALLPPQWEKENWNAFPLGSAVRPAHAAALLAGGMAAAFPSRLLEASDFEEYLHGELFEPKAPIEWVTVKGLGVGWLYKGKPSLPFTWRRFLRHRSR
ncbi:MAG: RsmB/NOP family class I SAM-dependent RNA methyltransferase [Bacteroidia bacterium]|nr:RsmB/NOP family class I SAM-dependent RNA methyltransferase [Bacteroidia bacterium]MDW8057337.1 RsmB/NOP family class I SAM-dependent RNA methyltransferase [Bacteroidia bacterium]